MCPGLKVPICRLKHWTEKNGGCAGAFCIAFWCCGYGSEVRCYHIFITQFSTESVLQDKQRLLKHLESEARNFPDSLWQLREARQWIRVKVGYPPCIWYWNDQSSCRFWGPTGPSLLISWSFDPHGKAYVELFASPIAGVGVRAFRSGAHAVVITSWALRNPETSTGFSWFLHLEKIKMLSPGVGK